MSAGFEINLNIDGAKKAVREARKQGLRDAVEYVLTEANKHIPHDEGNLERSGRADVNAEGTRGAVSYDTPYAVKQHEDMSLRHPGKGQGKWLENTMTREADTVREIIGTAIKGAIGD
ncbi:Minor capsid protein [Nocardioides sp. YR527]|uniref:minor capsid protein n=1 Tax=Nocardioides sp. YR527 TaxID=1881028 RepID=UPI00088075C5|nr:minor capsid protein [Nocardioides sp. YR527]SDL14420.1 Minor capsid protein [Nocardioides sp. YR527]